jgi:hypothetical protein
MLPPLDGQRIVLSQATVWRIRKHRVHIAPLDESAQVFPAQAAQQGRCAHDDHNPGVLVAMCVHMSPGPYPDKAERAQLRFRHPHGHCEPTARTRTE